MKIAVTYENGQVFQHFGHTEAVRTPRWRPCWLAAWPTIPTPYAATTTTVRGIPADTITRAVTPAAAMTTAADITADWA